MFLWKFAITAAIHSNLSLLLQRKTTKTNIVTVKDTLKKINNRYIYAIMVFLIIILFFDQFNVFEQIRMHKTLKDQEQQIEFYKQEIANEKQLLEDLQNDTATMERVARENYMMKRDNEVIYLIETQK